MRLLLFVCLSLFSVLTLGQEVPADKLGSFIADYYWIVGGIILLAEYLIGIAKIPANSTIELILSVFKMLKPKK